MFCNRTINHNHLTGQAYGGQLKTILCSPSPLMFGLLYSHFSFSTASPLSNGSSSNLESKRLAQLQQER